VSGVFDSTDRLTLALKVTAALYGVDGTPLRCRLQFHSVTLAREEA
jgi:hypothetical protein